MVARANDSCAPCYPSRCAAYIDAPRCNKAPHQWLLKRVRRNGQRAHFSDPQAAPNIDALEYKTRLTDGFCMRPGKGAAVHLSLCTAAGELPRAVAVIATAPR